MKKAGAEVLAVAGREVVITHAAKVLFPAANITKLDIARYYVAVAEGALRGAGGRPNMLVRYPNGIDGEFFYQKRAPESRPGWLEAVELNVVRSVFKFAAKASVGDELVAEAQLMAAVRDVKV